MSINKSKVYVYFFIILLPQLIISYPSHVKSASIKIIIDIYSIKFVY